MEHDAAASVVLTDKADAIVADLKANGKDRVERLLSAAFCERRKALYVTTSVACVRTSSAHNANLTSNTPQSPVVMAPDQDGAEVANTKEENE